MPRFTNDRDAKFYACNEGKNQINEDRKDWHNPSFDHFAVGKHKVNQFYRLLSLYYDDRIRFFKIAGEEYFDYDGSVDDSRSVRGFIE